MPFPWATAAGKSSWPLKDCFDSTAIFSAHSEVF